MKNIEKTFNVNDHCLKPFYEGFEVKNDEVEEVKDAKYHIGQIIRLHVEPMTFKQGQQPERQLRDIFVIFIVKVS